ncbi:MAG: sigma-E factor negative regulatory protein [Dyella sp.]
MTEHNRENLSASMDGRLADDELRFMLRRMEHDHSSQQRWSRYHVVRDCLRGELPLLSSADFSTRVMLAIDLEQSGAKAVVQPALPRRRWLHWSAGGAIAASVAVAALMTSQPAGQRPFTPPAEIVRTDTGQLTSSTGTDDMASAPVKIGSPAVVPPWLSSNAASSLSQQASATLGVMPNGGMAFSRSRSLEPYQLHHYRAVRGNDGSYLLLIDPADAAPPVGPAAARAVDR